MATNLTKIHPNQSLYLHLYLSVFLSSHLLPTCVPTFLLVGLIIHHLFISVINLCQMNIERCFKKKVMCHILLAVNDNNMMTRIGYC